MDATSVQVGNETLGSKPRKIPLANYFLLYVINWICCKESKEASLTEITSRKDSEDSR